METVPYPNLSEAQVRIALDAVNIRLDESHRELLVCRHENERLLRVNQDLVDGLLLLVRHLSDGGQR